MGSLRDSSSGISSSSSPQVVDAVDKQGATGAFTYSSYSIPSFFNLYRNARNVIPKAEAARVLL